MVINMDNIGQIMQEFTKVAFNYEEALKRINRTQDDVNSLRDIVKTCDDVPKSITDYHLLCFLCEGYTLNQAAQRVNLYYEIKLKNPHLFEIRDPESPEIQQCLKNQNFFYLPVTPEGKSVIFASLINFKASTLYFDNFVKTFLMLCESCLIHQGPQKGFIFVLDMKGVSLSHLTKPNINTVVTMLKFAFKATPAVITAINIFNAPSFFDLIIKLFLKPFMSKEYEHLINLNREDINWEQFYKNRVPKSSLPSNYGGDLDTVEVLHGEHCKELIRNKSYFAAESVQAYSTRKN